MPVQRRIRRVVVAAISLAWLGYVTLPYAMSWGPVLLVLSASGIAVYLANRGRQPA